MIRARDDLAVEVQRKRLVMEPSRTLDGSDEPTGTECAIPFQLEMFSLFRSTIPQAWIPHQRHNEGAAKKGLDKQRNP